MAIPQSYLDPIPIYGIVYWGRSGTLLLHSLLDSHPDVLSSVAYFWLYSFKMDEFLASGQERSSEGLMEFVCESFPYLFEHWPTFFPEMFRGENGDLPFGTNREKFRTAFRLFFSQFPTGTPFEKLPDGQTIHSFVLQAINVAYAISQGYPLASSRPVIVWQTHFWQSDYFRARFPKIRMLSAIRHPLKGYDSWQLRTFVDERVPPFWFYHTVKFRQMLEFVKVPPDLVERCRAIRFEDIHNRTESTMRSLAQWMGIRWDPCLLQSTFDGEPYWGVKGGYGHSFSPGEVPSKKAMVTGTKAFDESKMQLKYLGWIDRWRLATYCHHAFEKWNYESIPKNRFVRRLLHRYRHLLWAIPSKLDRRCFMEDLRLELQKLPKDAWRSRCQLVVTALLQFIPKLRAFRDEMDEVERLQKDWPSMAPLLPSRDSVKDTEKETMSGLSRAA